MSTEPNVYAYRGRQLLSAYHDRHPQVPKVALSTVKPMLRNQVPSEELPVCVIGTGTAGLYTAMIFESLNIPYQLIDADVPERVGGRLYTYHFPGGGPYDYYDIGAMRYPDTPFMKRTFDMVRNRGLKLTLIPYILQMVSPMTNTWLFFNNARVNNQAASVTQDPFGISGFVTDPSIATPEGASRKVAEVLQPFRDLFRTSANGKPADIAASMEVIFEQTNNFSMRSYMLQALGMSTEDINWCETTDKSTGWYDRAFTETILESLAFNWPGTPLPGPEQPKENPNQGWWCFDGGSSKLPQAMYQSLSQKAKDQTLFQSPVTAMRRDSQKEVMRVSINGTESPQEYAAIISTVPIPRLSLMNLTGVDINDNYNRWSAIRQLQYGPSVKVGMRFTTPWWETQLPEKIHGGQSFTDLPIRTVVYPSYPANATQDQLSKVMIVSYTWTQDAERMGSFIHQDGTARPELLDMIFRDLASVHGVTVDWIKQFWQGEYYAWDWLHNPLTMGGFAFFGPGVYADGDLYSVMLQPAAQGKLFFAGEATSTAHAWVAGAFDSAWRAVDQYLALNMDDDVRKKFWELWGPTEYWDESSNEELVALNRKLMDRHLMLSLYKDGVKFG